MVFQGDFTNQFNSPPFPPTMYLKPGSITPAISRTEVNVFSSIKPATCNQKRRCFSIRKLLFYWTAFSPNQQQRNKVHQYGHNSWTHWHAQSECHHQRKGNHMIVLLPSENLQMANLSRVVPHKSSSNSSTKRSSKHHDPSWINTWPWVQVVQCCLPGIQQRWLWMEKYMITLSLETVTFCIPTNTVSK